MPFQLADSWGPSPRVRGAERDRDRGGHGRGAIPARARSRVRCRGRLHAAREHPRSRGEQNTAASRRAWSRGPSPRAQGVDQVPLCDGVLVGTIPAVRETVAGGLDDRGAAGPSPRERGAVPRSPGMGTSPRIIPTGTGSSSPRWRAIRQGRDHPRRRGEQLRSSRPYPGFPGSSPQARGAVHPPVPGAGPGGIIPAGAGSSEVTRWAEATAGDHPRRRGEQSDTSNPGWAR